MTVSHSIPFFFIPLPCHRWKYAGCFFFNLFLFIIVWNAKNQYSVDLKMEAFSFSFYLLQNKPVPQLQSKQPVKTVWGRLLTYTDFFIRGKGFKQNRWCQSVGGGGCKEEAEASKCHVSLRHALVQLNGSGMTFQVQRRTFQQSFGVCWDNSLLHYGETEYGSLAWRNRELLFFPFLNKMSAWRSRLTSDCSSKAKDLKWMCVLAILTSVDRNTKCDHIKLRIKWRSKNKALGFIINWEKTHHFSHVSKCGIERYFPLDSKGNKYHSERWDLLTTFHCVHSIDVPWLHNGL